MPKLVYIGGYGHSGSTLLEYLIAGSPEVLACGEVASCLRGRKRKSCSCGRPPETCPVWKILHTARDAPTREHAELLDALLKDADGKYTAIVDSSKTAWGTVTAPFRLRRKFGPEFVLVHLMRQPAAVCWSVLRKKARRIRKKGRKPYPFFLLCSAVVASWSIANLSCELFRLLFPRQYVRLRYEDLAQSPTQTLRSLFEKILPDVEWNFDDADAHDNRHQLYGNSVKRHRLAIADVKEDLKWQTEMPPEYSRLILALSYFLRLRYGY